MGERQANTSDGLPTDQTVARHGDPSPTVPSSASGVLAGRGAFGFGFGAAVAAFLVVQLAEIWWASPSKNVGDIALIEMETRRVFSSAPPLLGAYSRYGWRHPGALLFWMWAPIYEVLGRSSKSLSSAAAVLVACCLVWLLVAIGRESIKFAASGAIAAMLTIATVGENGIASAWNVTATLVPFILVLFGAGVAMTAREPLAIGIWTIAWWLFIFESHVGTGVVVFPAVIAMVVVLAIRRLRRPFAMRFSMRARIATAVLVVAALPVVIDVTARRGGNLRAILGWTRGDGPSTAGFEAAFTIVGRATSLSFLASPSAPHITFPVIPEWGVVPGPLALVFVIACATAVRSRRHRWVAMLAVLGVTWMSAVVAVARIPVPVYFWLVEWLQPLGWTTWVVCAYVVGRELADRWSTARRGDRPVDQSPDGVRRSAKRPILGSVGASRVTRGVVAAGGMVGVIVALGSGPPTLPTDRTERQVSDLSAAIVPELGPAPTMIDAGADDISGAVMVAGLLNDLDRRGAAVCAGPLWGFRLTKPWQCDADRRPGSTVLVRMESAAMPPPKNSTLLAVSDYLSADQRREVDAATARVDAFLTDRGRSDLVERVGTVFVSTVLDAPEVGRADASVVADVALLDRVARLRGRRYGLYLVTPNVVPPHD